MHRDPIKSAARTLEVLELFHERREPLRLNYIFERLSYPQSSTTTLLKSMVLLGYLNYHRPSRTYFPTPRVAALGDWINHHIYGAGDLLDLMQDVQLRTDETVVVSSQNDIFIQHIRVLQPAHEFKLPPPEGSMRVLTKSAAGLVLLSGMTARTVDKLVRHINIHEGEKVDLPQLTEQLAWIRGEGYCLLAGFPLALGAGLAVPLPQAAHGIPLTLAVGGLNSRIARRKSEFVEVLLAAVAVYRSKLPAAELPAAPHGPTDATTNTG
ncbi:helix-turn-helix domain-containing protein [Phenylobacterium sp.]|uniref:IclR family transcriptional regulator n=1 Tax=Phenylobacterium sp. TaxID=1871053 RepID=UPI0025E9F014|nr:helix-turn-helix domain-containing protein [Phenylobacterium sp.]